MAFTDAQVRLLSGKLNAKFVKTRSERGFDAKAEAERLWRQRHDGRALVPHRRDRRLVFAAIEMARPRPVPPFSRVIEYGTKPHDETR